MFLSFSIQWILFGDTMNGVSMGRGIQPSKPIYFYIPFFAFPHGDLKFLFISCMLPFLYIFLHSKHFPFISILDYDSDYWFPHIDIYRIIDNIYFHYLLYHLVQLSLYIIYIINRVRYSACLFVQSLTPQRTLVRSASLLAQTSNYLHSF